MVDRSPSSRDLNSAAARRARADARRDRATLRKTVLLPVESDLSPIEGPEAVSLVARLTRESWSLSGSTAPTYTRQQIPCKFVPGRLT